MSRSQRIPFVLAWRSIGQPDPKRRIEDALAAYGKRLDAEPPCSTCGHPKRLHVPPELRGPWCAACAKACSFEPEARP